MKKLLIAIVLITVSSLSLSSCNDDVEIKCTGVTKAQMDTVIAQHARGEISDSLFYAYKAAHCVKK